MSMDDSKNPNHAFIIELGAGKRLRIFLSKKAAGSGQLAANLAADDDGDGDDDGLMPGYIPDDSLIPKRGGISFYDIGQLLVDNAWTDNLFGLNAGWELVGTTDAGTGTGAADREGSVQAIDPTTADYAAKAAQVLAAVSNKDLWDTVYKRIQKSNADNFRIRIWTPPSGYFMIDSESNRWRKEKTVKLSSAELATGEMIIRCDPFFGFIYFGPIEDGGVKVTSAPSYSSDAVEFKVGKRDIFYLAPALTLPSTFATGNAFGDPAIHDRQDIFINRDYSFLERLYANYTTFPRVFFESDLPTWFTYNAIGFWWILMTYPAGYTLLLYSLFWKQAQYIIGLGGTQRWNLLHGWEEWDDGIEGTLTFRQYSVYEADSLDDYPRHDVYPVPPELPQATENFEPSQFEMRWPTWSGAGDLLAVVKQKGNYYYVWGTV